MSVQNRIDCIDSDTRQTEVIALRPGMGKSQFIIKQMSIALQNNDGLMVVTDSVDRLTRMVEGGSIDDEITEYMKRNRDRISLLVSETFRDEIRTVFYKPIICMTTQRFFRMDPKQINEIIKSSKYDIKHILIDEQPFILEVKNIGIKQLTRIDEAVNAALTNLTDQEDKQAMIDSYSIINRSLRKAFKDAEERNQSGNETSFFYDGNIETAAETLRSLANKYKTELNAYNSEVPDLIETASDVVKYGGMVVSQKMRTKNDANRYNNYICFVKDYREWFTRIDTKIIVFDGTAMINPLYDSEHFNLIDCTEIEPELTKLTINIIDIAASKSKLMKDPLHLQAMVNYLKSEPERTQVVFTYKETEKAIKEVADSTEHFGNIKGFNKYRGCTNITQIGLNRYPDHVYQFLCGYAYLTQSTANKICRFINKKHEIAFRNKLILSDIVQNVFRSKIRNADNQDRVTYNIVFGYSGEYSEPIANKMLVQMIESYFKKQGSRVIRVDKPIQIKEFEIQKRKNADGMKSKAQRIFEWIQNKPSGYKFTPKEAREGLNMMPNEWYSAINANTNLKSILKVMKIKDGLYKV